MISMPEEQKKLTLLEYRSLLQTMKTNTHNTLTFVVEQLAVIETHKESTQNVPEHVIYAAYLYRYNRCSKKKDIGCR